MDTGFRGHCAHRDAAMPPPGADHASRKKGDPLPCPEDEEVFASRPDAEDMSDLPDLQQKDADLLESDLDLLHKNLLTAL